MGKNIKKNDKLSYIFLRKAMNMYGALGAFFVFLAGIAVPFFKLGNLLSPLDAIMIPLSNYLTILGVIITCVSIYFNNGKGNPHPPEKWSKIASAPIVIIACIIAGVLYAIYGYIPILVINGLSMLGFAGAVFRLQESTTE